jgi:hypothetical protein
MAVAAMIPAGAMASHDYGLDYSYHSGARDDCASGGWTGYPGVPVHAPPHWEQPRHVPVSPPSWQRSPYYGPPAVPCHVATQAQVRLRQLGYYRGSIDGIIGRGSRSAIVRFQQDRWLPVTGSLDSRTLRALGVRR